MQTKTNVLVFSLAVILSLSVVAIGEIPQAIADDDKKFKNPDFVSEKCLITDFDAITYPGFELPPEFDIEELDCKMKAWLDKKGTQLKYKIKISGMELIDSNTTHHPDVDGSFDDIDGIHIHKMTNTDASNPKGPHVLDSFGNPGFEDSDVIVKPVQGIVKGVWDDGDAPERFAANLSLLCEGKIFTAVHGEEEDRENHKAPYLKMLLEPTRNGEKACEKILDRNNNNDD